MTLLIILISAAAWIGCGVLAYGINFAYFQREYTLIAGGACNEDKKNSFIMALLGPLGLIFVFIFSERLKHGLLYRVKNR